MESYKLKFLKKEFHFKFTFIVDFNKESFKDNSIEQFRLGRMV